MSARLVVASVVAVLGLVLAWPAAARAPAGTAAVELEQGGACSLTVTYMWSDFKGRDLTAYFGVARSVGGGAELWHFVAAGADGSGAATHTFDMTGTGTFTWRGAGRLVDARGRVLGGSDVRSTSGAVLNCPSAA